MRKIESFLCCVILITAIMMTSAGSSAAAPKYEPDVPDKITTPDTVETHANIIDATQNRYHHSNIDKFLSLSEHIDKI